MEFDRDKIKRQSLAYLIAWQKHKEARRMDDIGVPGKSPISQAGFAAHHWWEFLPGCGAGLQRTPTSYQYVKDSHRNEALQFERAIADVFQELEAKRAITVAAPYDREGGTTGYGLSVGGSTQHNWELTTWAASLAASDAEGLLAVLNLPPGFQDLSGQVVDFVRRTGTYDKNVFLIMPFGPDPQLDAVRTSLTTLLSTKGFNVYRADDKEYEDGLWDNICVYMLGCKYAIAIFKVVGGVGYNPNVGVEIGFMMALNKRVLILKDTNLPRLPGDLIHRLYHQVDFSDLPAVQAHVTKWFDDLSRA